MRYLLLTIIGSLFFVGTASAQTTAFSQNPFTDVSANRADYKAIEYLRTQNIIKGYMDGTFRPNAIISRAEFVEFIVNPFILNTNGLKDCVKTHVPNRSKTVYFSDVTKNDWFAENICFAKNKQLIDGYPDGTFQPGDSINFAEAAKIISNTYGLNISDYQIGKVWYQPYVQSLSDLHAIPTNVRRMNQALSRADMAQIVYRLVNDDEQQPSMVFNQVANSLSRRPYIEAMAPEPPAPLVSFYKPTTRSIQQQYFLRNLRRNLYR